MAYQAFHHIAILAIFFVAMAIHGRSTEFHNNRTELDVARFDFSEFTDGFLRETIENSSIHYIFRGWCNEVEF